MRLSDSNKGWIESQFDRVIQRAIHNHPFPIPKDDLNDWFLSFMPDNISSAWREIQRYNPYLLRNSGWRACFVVHTYEGKYHCELGDVGAIPPTEPEVSLGDMHYNKVLKWASEYHDTNAKIIKAQRYVSDAIQSCTSAGQILRVLPEDCVRFIPPDVASSFGNAERKSRIPANFSIDKELEELTMNMLALGSISPEEVTGQASEVTRYEEKQ
jgi:hypothetical protein